MTLKRIEESGITFGPFPSENCFHIEKSKTYQAIMDNVKIAEFLLLQPHPSKVSVLWIVEAKSSSPRPETQPNYDDFILEIREKMVNTFSLGWASCLKRHREAEAELPDAIKLMDLSKTDVKFVLVINGHREAWLPPLQDSLLIALRSTVKTWAFSPTSVAVLNDAMAREYNLILPQQENSHEGV